ncbi:MAG: hypothetical protein AAGH89_12195, partial [Verrucomicrobiota bacterium]
SGSGSTLKELRTDSDPSSGITMMDGAGPWVALHCVPDNPRLMVRNGFAVVEKAKLLGCF